MTQADIAKIIGVSTAYISDYENGKELTPATFPKIKNGLDDYCKHMGRDAYLRMRIKEVGYKLEYESLEEQIATLGHLVIHIGKLQLDLYNEHLDQTK
jgi:transcriptional regulator with XRE-family HTH domain